MPNTSILQWLEQGREIWNQFILERAKTDNSIIDLSEVDLEGRNLSGYLFININFSRAQLNGVNLSNSRLNFVDLNDVELRDADLTGVSFDYVAAIEADFSNSRLHGCLAHSLDAMKASFRGANISSSKLHGRLSQADFSEAKLIDTDLNGIDCAEASFRDADLTRADLSDTNLNGVDFRGAILEGVDLSRASLYRIIPEDIDLSLAKNVPSLDPVKVIAILSGFGRSGGSGYSDPPEFKKTAIQIRVFFATDRMRESGRFIFGNRRSANVSSGYCDVSIPLYRRQVGSLPRPSIWRLEFRENLKHHVTILSSECLQADLFEEKLTSELNRGDDEILLFVHGYNVSFEDAVRRTAQLAYDLNFKGVPVLYSWTSQNTIRGYPVDLANNEMTRKKLTAFLCDLQRRSAKLHLLSHSMGGRAVCLALEIARHECPAISSRFENLIFAAPDVHVPSFEDALPDLRGVAVRITLYCCPEDFALAASRRFHSVPRAGEAGISSAGLDNIDISDFSGSFPYHSGYDDRGVLSDMFEIIQHGTEPSRRFGLVEYAREGGTYFKMCE